MLTFKEFLNESCEGNYVSTFTSMPILPTNFLPKSGTIVPEGKHHLTLVYSEFSDVDSRLIRNLVQMLPPSLDLVVLSAEVFDSKDENDDLTDKGTLVLKVKNRFVDQLHDSLISLGMQHSYPDFAQHVTIAYKVDREEAYEKAGQLNDFLQELPTPIVLKTNGYESEGIDKNWSDKLKG